MTSRAMIRLIHTVLTCVFYQFGLSSDDSRYSVNGRGGALGLNLYYGTGIETPVDSCDTSTAMPARVFETPLPAGLSLMVAALVLTAAVARRR